MRLIIAGCVLFYFSHSVTIAQNKPFIYGEHIKYKIYFSSILVGSADLLVQLSKDKAKEKCYHIKGSGKSAPFFDFFFKVRDVYETYLDTTKIVPVEFIRNVYEGGHIINQHYFFRHSTLQVLSKDSLHMISNNTQDMLSAFFYARCLDEKILKNKNDSMFFIPIFIDDENYDIKVKYLGNELLKTNWGNINCMIFKPIMQEGRVFENGEQIKIWVSDDNNRILVKAEAKIWAGTIRAQIQDYFGLRHHLKFID